MRKRKSVVTLVAAALLITGSGYAASGGIGGTRSNDRPSNPGNGHCGHSDRKPPCRSDSGEEHHKSGN